MSSPKKLKLSRETLVVLSPDFVNAGATPATRGVCGVPSQGCTWTCPTHTRCVITLTEGERCGVTRDQSNGQAGCGTGGTVLDPGV
jgi:hypothetical protein